MIVYCELCKKKITDYHYIAIAESDNGNMWFKHEMCLDCYNKLIKPIIERQVNNDKNN